MAGNPYDLTSRELLSILFKEKLKLILVFVVLCALVIGYSYTLTPYYEATTRLLVKTGPDPTPISRSPACRARQNRRSSTPKSRS
jgi:uncharacterized protein involved in exopolysaccharide biosynthesis